MALNTGDKNANITVLLVTPSNDMIVDRLEMKLKDGLLPIRELKQKWNAKVRAPQAASREHKIEANLLLTISPSGSAI